MSWKEVLLSKQYLFHKDNGLTLLDSGSLGEARIEFEKALSILRRIKSLEEEELEGLLNEALAVRVLREL